MAVQLRHGLVLVLLAFGLIIYSRPVNASETYSLSVSPDRVEEGNGPGVGLTLNVRGATAGSFYQFVWIVMDPAGNNYTASKSASASQPNFVITTTFPEDFTNASVRFVGTYVAIVNQLVPAPRLNIASGQFRAGLTDSESYQRTFPVLVKATGYKPNETVTINIAHDGLSAPSFPAISETNPDGSFLYVWNTAPGLVLGTYIVTLSGAATSKFPDDSQTFTVSATGITVVQFSLASTNLFRTQRSDFYFVAKYLSGGPVQNGSGDVLVTEPDGVTSHLAPVIYDANRGGFTSNYSIPLSGQLGAWWAMVPVGSIDDGFGNVGPQTSPSESFSVQSATLAVSPYVPNATYGSGSVVPLYATIVTPGGPSFTRGTVNASFLLSNRPVGVAISLSYDQTLGRWVGSYVIQPGDPSGIWSVQLTASDNYGNGGTGSTSILVQVQPQQSPLVSLWWVFVVMAVAGGLVSALLLMKRKVSRKELKVDLRVIEMEANRLKNHDFFRSVEGQLKGAEDSTKPQVTDKNDG